MIPIVSTNPSKNAHGRATPSPSTPTLSMSPTSHTFPPASQGPIPIIFDAPVVARQELGWEEMLETAALEWMQAVVNEKRSERS